MEKKETQLQHFASMVMANQLVLTCVVDALATVSPATGRSIRQGIESQLATVDAKRWALVHAQCRQLLDMLDTTLAKKPQ